MTLSEKNCLKNNWLESPLTIQLWQWHESLVEITDDGRGPFPTSSRSLRASLVHVQSTSQLATPTISIYLLRDRTCIYKYSRPLWWYTRFLLEGRGEWTSPARLYCTNATTKCWTHATCRRQEYTLAGRACNALHVWRLGSHALPHTQARTPRGRACWQEHFLDLVRTACQLQTGQTWWSSLLCRSWSTRSHAKTFLYFLWIQQY